MFYYIIPYFLLLSGSLLIKKYNFDRTVLMIFLLLLLLPAILLVVLRGNIGTDTMQYLGHFRNLSYDVEAHEYEPGFNFLSSFINSFGFNERVNVAIVSLITIILLWKSFSKSIESLLLFSGFLFPVFFYDMTMNGLRYGLSFALCAIAIDALYVNKIKTFLLFAIFAVSIQYSSFLIVFVFLVFKLESKYLIRTLIIILLLIILNVEFLSNYLLYFYDKQDAYKDLVSPSITSGLGPLVLFISLMLIFFIYSTKQRSNKILFLLLVFEIFSFLLAKISYAGLRFQMVFLFCLLLLIKQECILVLDKKIFLKQVVFLGVLGFLLTIKNINSFVEDVESPFVPYKFFWQEK